MFSLFRGSKRTPTTSFRFRVSRVTPAEPRSDSRTRRRSKIARKTCVLQIAFSAPRLRRPNSSGSPQNASEPGRQSGAVPVHIQYHNARVLDSHPIGDRQHVHVHVPFCIPCGGDTSGEVWPCALRRSAISFEKRQCSDICTVQCSDTCTVQ